MARIIYPLSEVLEVKKKRVEEAEKVVQARTKALEKEREQLKKREEERDKVKEHEKEKLKQLRDELDGGTTSPKIQQMKAYLKVVKEKLVVEEKKVDAQKSRVETAKKELQIAQDDLKQKRMEVDKLEMHKKDWTFQMKKEMQIIEERELDELGSVIYTAHLKKRKE